jgi:hypothetical protein
MMKNASYDKKEYLEYVLLRDPLTIEKFRFVLQD